jgi:AcrR family transcriptional regulator
MNDRRRGEGTKEKILEAACKVFAEKGYRDATHAEICRRAGVNVAAVNYYFASKENLYRSVFEHLTQKVERLYPLDGGLPGTSSPERRLHAFIHAHLSRVFDPELLGDLHRIHMAELFDPTGLLEELLGRQLARYREHVQRILRELLGPEVSQRDVEWCEMSIVAQCFIGAPGPPGKGPRDIFKLEAAGVDRLADHILRFSLAGVKAIRRKGAELPEGKHKRM